MTEMTDNQTQEQPTERMTKQELFRRLVTLHNEISTLNEDVKQLVADAKDQGFDKKEVGFINTVAKAYAVGTASDLEAKCKTTIDKIEELLG